MTDSQVETPFSAEVKQLIDRLELSPHPEGGWYRETWRSDVVLPRAALPGNYDGDRRALTSILFLLPGGTQSRWHRVLSEELWLHHRGDDLCLSISKSNPDSSARDEVSRRIVGQGANADFQAVVPPGHWQEARALPGPAGFVLVGCVVAPGFEFADFEMLSL